jgi:uncharacterized Ntn-hydrolase superfamily protein
MAPESSSSNKSTGKNYSEAMKTHPLLLLGLLPSLGLAQPGELAHTFSIVARDPVSGQIGVAVQSHWPAVGSMVIWARAGVGAVATQSFVRPRYGPDSLDLMQEGKSPAFVFELLSKEDPGLQGRQLGLVDQQGRTFAFTGSRNIPVAQHFQGQGFAVQANLMKNDRVVPAMARAFQETQAPLALRLVAALRAGQAAGGDIRGRQSAALLVVSGTFHGDPERDKLFDLRVDDHPHPIEELSRLLDLRRAYNLSNSVQTLVGQEQYLAAAKLWPQVEALCPDCQEPRFWYVTSLLAKGKIQAAQPHLKKLQAANPDWIETLRRLPGTGILPAGDEGKRLIDGGLHE